MLRPPDLLARGTALDVDVNENSVADAEINAASDASDAFALLTTYMDELALAADALLLPRETWQGLARAWRDQSGPMAERLNAMPKYVVSATLESAAEWDHTSIVG